MRSSRVVDELYPGVDEIRFSRVWMRFTAGKIHVGKMSNKVSMLKSLNRRYFLFTKNSIEDYE
jgi:hypothetical protein